MSKGKVIIISGPAGSGKGTIVKNLLETDPAFNISVSLTTRAPRPNEVEGVSYFYVSKEEFKKRLDEGRILEHNEYCGNLYGTPRDFVEKLVSEGKFVILEIDTNGAAQIKKLLPEAVTVFVIPERKELIRERLVGRGTETAEVIEKRLLEAEAELIAARNYDYVVINATGRSEEAAKRIIDIAYLAEGSVPSMKEILETY